MKKFCLLLTSMVLALWLCGCSQLQDIANSIQHRFPENTTVLSVDVTGMSIEDALTQIQAAADVYQLTANLDGTTVVIDGKDIQLSCDSEEFLLQAERFLKRESYDFSQVIRYDRERLATLLDDACNQPVEDAALYYDEAAGQYALQEHRRGQQADGIVLAGALLEPISSLQTQYERSGLTQILEPKHYADSPQAQDALTKINKMIELHLSYRFQGEDDTLQIHQIPQETIRSFVGAGEDNITPCVKKDVVAEYTAQLKETYSTPGFEADFLATNGNTIGLQVSYIGMEVDQEALAADIQSCLEEGTSGSRTAPYVDNGDPDMAYGGNYIEVNLSAQHMWFYVNGECVVSTDLVSGMVGAEMNTPTGVYQIYDKDTDTYLVGEDYRSYVNYWMPFYGGYGLHDATWRSNFGGEIYLYGGSHGCVNLPLDAASTLYNNCSVGTPVILYGGVRSVPRLEQKLSGTTAYKVADDSDMFQLDIEAKYEEPDFTYTSSNENVVTVSKDGKVSVHSAGEATITVKAEKESCYDEATKKVKVTVYSACLDGRHAMGKAEVIKKATCQPGLERTQCAKCDHFTETTLEPVKSHSYGQWEITKEATCIDEGTQEHTCTLCKEDKETETIPATGQHTEGKWKVTKEATCVQEGQQQLLCQDCEAVLKEETIPATGEHKAGKWVVVTEPTCTKTGEKTKTCTMCDLELERKAVKKAEHTFGKKDTCSVCGAAKPEK